MTSDASYIVARLGQSGDGVIGVPKGPAYVVDALPGERVERVDGNWRRAEDSVSPERRRVALCPHVAQCGGCQVQHMGDEIYRAWKSTLLLSDALRTHGIEAESKPMISVPLNARRRAVLTARRMGKEIELGFHGHRSDAIANIEACAILSPRIVAALPQLRLLASLLLAHKAETHVTVIETRSGLDIAFETARRDLGPDKRAAVTDATKRMRLARLAVGSDTFVAFADPVLTVSGVDVIPPPGAFLQAAAEAEQAMAALAAAAVGSAKRVADLFSGLGTFTFALAKRAQVLAIDSERPLIDALANAARKASGLKPIETKVRDLFRDPLSPRELDAFGAVVFDPPRAGAKGQAEALARSKVPVVVAVSCNPATLARDLRILTDGGYRLKSVTPVDQFLFTPHLEAVAVLERPKARR